MDLFFVFGLNRIVLNYQNCHNFDFFNDLSEFKVN